MGRLPLGGQPDDVIPNLASLVGDLVGPPSVVSFRFGRTRNAAAVRETLRGGDRLYALYETDKPHHAVLVEDALARAFGTDPRLDEDVAYDDCDPADRRPCTVYVAVRMSAP